MMQLLRRSRSYETLAHGPHAMQSHAWFINLAVINCFLFFFLTGAFQTQLAIAQNGRLDSIEVVICDPLINSPTEDGFRPVIARVCLPNGALANEDHDFWIVQRLGTYYSYADGRAEKVLHKKFTLKAGTNQVEVSFSAQCPGEHFQNEELFIERDGNLTFAPVGNQDFCKFERGLKWSERIEGSFNVLMICKADGMFRLSLRRKLIDFQQRDQGYETDFYPQADEKPAEIPESLLGFDRVLWETLPMRYLMTRGDGQNALNINGEEVATYRNTAEFLLRNRWFSVGNPEEIPSEWQALVNLDLLLMSEQELAGLTNEQLNAIRLWLAAGGRLSLTNCDIDKSRLEELSEKLIGPRKAGERRLRNPNWMLLAEQDYSGKLVKYFNDDSLSGSMLTAQPSPAASISLNRCPTRAVGEIAEIGNRDFLFFDQVQGRVICTAAKVEEFEPEDWRRMLLAAYGNGKSGTVRSTLGQRTLAGGPLVDFEVTGVGQPPKLLFLGLITLFALVAGPLAYTVLYRSRRVNFLLVVVPTISLLTTLGLVLYVVLADGFQFQSRRLSFTRLDQNAQRAVTLTRHAVFSSTNPRSYMANEDELFLPAWLGGRDRQQVQYSDTGSRLVSNWIRARMPHQVSIASVQAVTAGLDVSRKDAGGEVTVSVTNRLGGQMVAALLKIENQWYEVGPLGPGETASAKISSPAEFQSRIRPAFNQALPAAATMSRRPTEPDDLQSNDSAFVSLLERPELIDSELIQDGQYFALLEDYPGAGQLKDYAKYQHQLHLIHGNW